MYHQAKVASCLNEIDDSHVSFGLIVRKRDTTLTTFFIRGSNRISFTDTQLKPEVAPFPLFLLWLISSFFLKFKEMFTNRLYLAEKDVGSYSSTMRRMSIFLKEHLLPVCVKTNALVFLHDQTCSISQAFGQICQAERQKRNGTLPFSVMTIIGANSVVHRAQNDEDSVANQLRRGSRRWKQYNEMMLGVFTDPLFYRNYAADFPFGMLL